MEGGEEFQFDMYGTIATPDNPVDCIRIDESITDNIRAIGGGTGASDIYDLTFTLREV